MSPRRLDQMGPDQTEPNLIDRPGQGSTPKRAAIEAFASQLTERGPDLGPVLPAGIVAHFTRSEEVLLR